MIYFQWRNPGGELFKVSVTLSLSLLLFLFVFFPEKTTRWGSDSEQSHQDRRERPGPWKGDFSVSTLHEDEQANFFSEDTGLGWCQDDRTWDFFFLSPPSPSQMLRGPLMLCSHDICRWVLVTETNSFLLLLWIKKTHWVVPFLLSYILRDVSFAEVGRVSRVVLWEPIHLCTCVIEEGDDGEAARSETPSLLSYTLRYVSFAEVGSICRVALREPMHRCTCVSEEGGDGEAFFKIT
jgi:hypothetical protein